MKLSEIFETKVQTNSIILVSVLVPLQVFILYKLNGVLTALLTASCVDPVIMGVIFGPTIALVFTLRSFASKIPGKSTRSEEQEWL